MHNQRTAQAQILLIAGEAGMEVEVQHVADLECPAVILSRWIGENLEHLMGRALRDHTEKTARASKAMREIITSAKPRLVDTTGKLITKDHQ